MPSKNIGGPAPDEGRGAGTHAGLDGDGSPDTYDRSTPPAGAQYPRTPRPRDLSQVTFVHLDDLVDGNVPRSAEVSKHTTATNNIRKVIRFDHDEPLLIYLPGGLWLERLKSGACIRQGDPFDNSTNETLVSVHAWPDGSLSAAIYSFTSLVLPDTLTIDADTGGFALDGMKTTAEYRGSVGLDVQTEKSRRVAVTLKGTRPEIIGRDYYSDHAGLHSTVAWDSSIEITASWREDRHAG